MSDSYTPFEPHNPIDQRQLDANGGVGIVQYGPGDANLIVGFYPRSIHDKARSEKEGKPIFIQQDYVKIQQPGEKLTCVDRPATDIDKARFRNHWAAYQQGKAPPVEGIPLTLLFPHKPEIVSMLEAYKVQTVEQLARLSASGIQTVGMGSQEWVNKAQAYLNQAEKGVNHHKFSRAIEEKNAQIAQLKKQLDEVSANVAQMLAGQIKAPVSVPAQFREAPKMPDFSNNFDTQTSIINNTMEPQVALPPAMFTSEIAPPRRGRPKGSKNKETI